MSTPSEENHNFPKNNIRDIIKIFESAKFNSPEKQTFLKSKTNANVLEDIFSKQEFFMEEQGSNEVCSSEKQFENTANVLNNTEKRSDNGFSKTSRHRSQSKDRIVDKFETYVRNVRIYSEVEKVENEKHLFTCCLLVGLIGKAPYIKSKFPKNVRSSKFSFL